MGNLKSSDAYAGDLETIQTVLPKAREVWARMSHSQTVDDAIDAGQDYLSGSSSGVCNQFKRILSPTLSRGFSDAEKKAMRSELIECIEMRKPTEIYLLDQAKDMTVLYLKAVCERGDLA